MAIKTVSIENFKAFGARVDVELKPITIFLGANSSGKSSVLHALAALRQTADKTVSERALVLDGNDTITHLGRFVDAVHGHAYQSTIGLGISFEAPIQTFGEELDAKKRPKIYRILSNASHTYWWQFRGTLRTQQIHLSSRTNEISISPTDHRKYTVHRPSKDHYVATIPGSNSRVPLVGVQNLAFRMAPTGVSRSAKYDVFYEMQLFDQAEQAMLRELSRIHYLGPFRATPERQYPFPGAGVDVGPDGSGAVPLLVDELTSTQKRTNFNYVREWLGKLGLAADISLSRQGSSDTFKLELKVLPNSVDATPADIGFGFSQVLPVVTQCAFAEDYATLIFEQPELHLHPKAQRGLGAFFANAVGRRHGTYLVETHSRELVGGIQDAVRKGAIATDDVVLYLVKFDGVSSVLERFSIDDDGELWSQWAPLQIQNWDAG